MAFLENDGDIILDTVLTDLGRYRIARNEFRIAKFAVFDDEIDYTRYNKNHPSGSAYFDLELLQTPILEAFTNNTSCCKSHLLSIPRTNLLYLPILKLNEKVADTERHSNGSFVIAVDKTTEDLFDQVTGVMLGEKGRDKTFVRIDQGLDTTEVSPAFTLSQDLVETQYTIEVDNRLGYIVDAVSGQKAQVNFIDDDNIANYYLTKGTDINFVKENTDRTTAGTQTIAGPRGTYLQFRIKTSLDLNTQTYLFTLLGSTTSMTNNAGGSTSVYYIDDIIRVFGATTGYRVDIPVRFIKTV